MAKDATRAEAVFKSNVTPDFKYVQFGKAFDLKSYVPQIKMSIEMTNYRRYSSRIVSLKDSGKTATAKMEEHTAGTFELFFGMEKKPTKKAFDSTDMFTEEDRKVNGKWKMSKVTFEADKDSVDGDRPWDSQGHLRFDSGQKAARS